MNTRYGSFINGAFRYEGSYAGVIDPSDRRVIASVAAASDRDVEDAIACARQAFDHGPWPRLPLEERSACLQRIARGILERAAELAELESRNTGKPIKETTFMDIPSSARSFEYLSERLVDFLSDEHIRIEHPCTCSARLRREPHGVAVLIVPWNYPLLIASWKLASALAAGNTVVLKPASLTPLSVLELAGIIRAAGVPDGVVNVIVGRGPDIGQQICRDRRVDMISFTGSNQTGKQIIGYTAEAVKKLIMELGGKSASLVCKDADLELAVNGALCSIFLNQGQMCTAMSRIYVEEPVYETFLRDFCAKAQRIKLGKALDFQAQMGPLASAEHRERVLGFLERATAQGARLLCGGTIPSDEELREGFFLTPAVLEQVAAGMELFGQEVFGPVVSIGSFKQIPDAVKQANATEFALAASIWSADQVKAHSIADALDAGIVWVNTYGMFLHEVPYGGFKQSGFGKELGKEGFWEYTRLKTIIRDASDDAKPLVHYWYGF